MRRTSFSGMACSLAQTLGVVGEWWTLLVLRDLFFGLTRFDDIRADLGIATNVLTDRLATLVTHGLAERHAYQQHPPRYDYQLTSKGRDLFPAIAALIRWGDRWEAGETGPPLLFVHDDCGQLTEAVVVCSRCQRPLDSDNVTPIPGPGGRIGPGTARAGLLIYERAQARPAPDAESAASTRRTPANGPPE